MAPFTEVIGDCKDIHTSSLAFHPFRYLDSCSKELWTLEQSFCHVSSRSLWISAGVCVFVGIFLSPLFMEVFSVDSLLAS